MAGPFPGALFAPTDDSLAESQQQQGEIRRSQTPLKVVSLQLPTTVNPRAPISRTLLEPRPNVGGVNPDQAVLASIIRALMGQNAVLPQSVRGRSDDSSDGGGPSSGGDERRNPVSQPRSDPGPNIPSGGNSPLPPPVFTPKDPPSGNGQPPVLTPEPGPFPSPQPDAPISTVPDSDFRQGRSDRPRGPFFERLPQYKQDVLDSQGYY